MKWYVIPALVSLLIKLGILFLAHRHWSNSKIFFYMIAAFAALNISELLLFLNFFTDSTADITLRIYYICVMIMFAFLCSYSVEVSERKKLKSVPLISYAIAIVAILLLLFTNLIIAGYQPIGYAITRIPGNHYWIFQVLVLAALVFTPYALIKGYKSSTQNDTQARCLYVFFAILPFLLSCIAIIIIMALGIKINAMVILPITSTIFVLATLKSEEKRRIDVRQKAPFSPERKTANDMKIIMSDYAREKITHAQMIDQIELRAIKYKHIKSGGNVSETARSMKVPRSTFYSKIRRLDIKHIEEEK